MARDHMSVGNEKQQCRTQMRKLLGEIPDEHLRTSSTAICNQLRDNFELTGITAIFSSHGPEIDLSGLHGFSSRLAYPLCHPGGMLTFHVVDDPQDLTPGTLGILEPGPQRHPEVMLKEINLFLCPGLAFGRDGSRLGHGGGFYDRALAGKSPRAEAWGIGMDIQMLDTVICDPHDQGLNGVITESGIIRATPD